MVQQTQVVMVDLMLQMDLTLVRLVILLLAVVVVRHQVVRMQVLADLEVEVVKKLHQQLEDLAHRVKEVVVVMVPTTLVVAVAVKVVAAKMEM